jgi:hypothetical protein
MRWDFLCRKTCSLSTEFHWDSSHLKSHSYLIFWPFSGYKKLLPFNAWTHPMFSCKFHALTWAHETSIVLKLSLSFFGEKLLNKTPILRSRKKKLKKWNNILFVLLLLYIFQNFALKYHFGQRDCGHSFQFSLCTAMNLFKFKFSINCFLNVKLFSLNLSSKNAHKEFH